MSRFLLALIATLTALAFTLALIARAWGETQPPHPALRGFVEGCEAVPQPCWYGIVPGETPVRVAANTLIDLGYTASDDSGSFGAFTFISPLQVPANIRFAITCNVLNCAELDFAHQAA